ncbi:MAG: preprotein translocase subunit YajC [Acidimicrobiales bacterium]
MNALQYLLAADKAQGGIASFLPLLLIVGFAGYVMIVPQRKQKRKQEEMLARLKVGDDVITSGGIYGSVTFLEDKIAHVLVDTDVVIRISKSALTRLESGADDDDDEVTDVTDSADDNAGGAIVVADDATKGKASKPATS